MDDSAKIWSVPGLGSIDSHLSTASFKKMLDPSIDIVRVKQNRIQAEMSVQLMANRIALLKVEEERTKRKIKSMNTTVQKVQSCQKEEMELKKQLRTARQQAQEAIEQTASRAKQQSLQARQNMKLKLKEELRLKQMQVKEDREKAVLMKSARDQTETFPEGTVEEIRKMKLQLKKRKEEHEERLRRKLEEKRGKRLKAELERRNQAEKRLVEMAEMEQRMLERLMTTRSMQKKVYAKYEKLFKPGSYSVRINEE